MTNTLLNDPRIIAIVDIPKGRPVRGFALIGGALAVGSVATITVLYLLSMISPILMGVAALPCLMGAALLFGLAVEYVQGGAYDRFGSALAGGVGFEVGYGDVCTAHARAYQQHLDTSLFSIRSADDSSRKVFAKRYGNAFLIVEPEHYDWLDTRRSI